MKIIDFETKREIILVEDDKILKIIGKLMYEIDNAIDDIVDQEHPLNIAVALSLMSKNMFDACKRADLTPCTYQDMEDKVWELFNLKQNERETNG
jgi:hypothetical protein